MLAPYSHILFDLDGTLTDPQIGITHCIAYALDKMGFSHAGPDSLVHLIGPPLRPAFIESFGMTPAQAEQAVAFYRERFTTIGLYENRVFDGVPALLSRLTAAGKVLGLATSKPEVYARQILEHFDLAGYFDQISGASLDNSLTDKAGVIALALSRWPKVPTAEIVMVGDRHHDLEGAASQGLAAIGVLFGFGSRDELAACQPVGLAATMSDLFH